MKHILNKFNTRALLATSLVLLASCESFLDLKPTNALLADNAVYNAKTSRALVNSAYSSLKSYNNGSAIILGVIPADNVFFGGSQSQNIELDNNAFTVTNSAIVSAYASNYSTINVVNWAISEIPKVVDETFTTGEQDKLVGEAYFIRAFSYFNLVRSWGGIQLQLNPTTDLSSLGDIERSSKEETYAQIFDDLAKADSLLPTDDATTRNKIQHSILKAFRSRVNLYAKNYEQAETDASEVIGNTKYELVKPYSNFFVAPFLTKEAVFELSATTNNAGTSGSAWFPASGTPKGSYEYRPTNGIITLLNDATKGGTRKALLAKRGTDYYGNLYYTYSPNTNPAYVIRIADLYLIRAEARLQKATPDYAGAISDLNAIRGRADATLFPVGSTDKATILQAIWDERRLEFAFEADRWYELVRTEQANSVLGVEPDYWLFPIPQADVLADPSLNGENNPSY
jgi:starch-binding outer membrane protein, SusD/RagB family